MKRSLIATALLLLCLIGPPALRKAVRLVRSLVRSPIRQVLSFQVLRSLLRATLQIRSSPQPPLIMVRSMSRR